MARPPLDIDVANLLLALVAGMTCHLPVACPIALVVGAVVAAGALFVPQPRRSTADVIVAAVTSITFLATGVRALVTIGTIVREARMTGHAVTGSAVRSTPGAQIGTGGTAAGGKSAARPCTVGLHKGPYHRVGRASPL